MKDDDKDIKISIQPNHYHHQSYPDQLDMFVTEYLTNNRKQRLLETMKVMSNLSQGQDQSASPLLLPNYYQRFLAQFTKIINQKHYRHNNNNKQQTPHHHYHNILSFTLTNDQEQKLFTLIKCYQSKITNQLITCMRKNSLLQPIKNSKLQQISRSYQLITLPKKQCLQFKNDHNQTTVNLYYLLDGDVEKVRYYSFHGNGNKFNQNNGNGNSNVNNDTFSLKSAIQKVNERNFSMQKQQNKDNQSHLSKKKLIKINHSVQIQQSQQKNYPLKSFLTKRKSLSRNTLRTLIQSGQFIGDEFFTNSLPDHAFPTMTKFIVISQKAILIQFSGQLINKIINEYNYHEDSKSFYHQKSSIELKQIHSMRLFDKRYKSLCRKNEQNQLKRQCSPQIQEMKKMVLKRYVTSNSQSQVDKNSPKQLSKILSKRRKKMNINRKNNFQLPVVQVFSTHSEKKRSHQNAALSPIAIVKTNRNNSLLNKSDNIIESGQKSQIYQIRSWQSKALQSEEKISPSMKQLHEITKQKRHLSGGFQLLQLERVLQKIKVNLKKK